jgi:hypothetical protein
VAILREVNKKVFAQKRNRSKNHKPIKYTTIYQKNPKIFNKNERKRERKKEKEKERNRNRNRKKKRRNRNRNLEKRKKKR